MIVLGVDPGSHATGFGAIATGPVVCMLGGGVIRTKSSAPLPERLLAIHEGISGAIAEFKPDVLAVEDLFNAKNARSSLILGHARGVILLAGAGVGVSVAEYAPREIKQALTGNGGATKEQVRFMVMRLLGLKETPALDLSDALAVALAHSGRAQLGKKLSRKIEG
ncbi:MAG: crossover junction endodeoxyribonuclease RuvC [Gemmatimonadales bacterium]|nr:crossover junction endodeoxyribonuclease RuvC [Gemmatimonadales bacterium]